MGRIFFTADSHFYHKNIITSCNRPFTTVNDMNETIVERWNATIAKDDLVFHLGDVACGYDKLKAIGLVKQLNGQKILITGNHDHHIEKHLRKVFMRVIPYFEIKHTIEDYGIIKICMFHYPIENWNRKHFSAIHLHGHSHGGTKGMTNRFDVGVDVNNFTPISLDEIMKKWKINEPFKSNGVSEIDS